MTNVKELMKSNFIKYYFPVFVTGLMMIFPIMLLNYNSDNLLDMIIGLSILLTLLTIIIGTLNFKFGDKLKARTQKKALEKDLFQQFIYKGFKNNEVSIFGYINDYYVIISDERDSQPRKWIEVVILFNPKQGHQFIPRYVFENLYNEGKNNYSWNSNSLAIEKVYGLKMPKYMKILTIIEEAISLLKKNNISSIKVEEWNLLIEDSIKHYNQKLNLKIK